MDCGAQEGSLTTDDCWSEAVPDRLPCRGRLLDQDRFRLLLWLLAYGLEQESENKQSFRFLNLETRNSLFSISYYF